MQIRLHKIFNIFHKRTIVPAAYAYAVLLILLTLNEISSSSPSFKERSMWFSLILVPIWSALHTLHFTGEMLIENDTISYVEFERRKYKRFGRDHYLHGYRHYEVTLPVESFELRQNFIEKLFNVGHIRFVDKLRKTTTIYGIPDFNTKKVEIERYFNHVKNESYYYNV